MKFPPNSWMILVTGSRSINEEQKIRDLLDKHRVAVEDQGGTVIALVEGDAVGVDRICGAWAVDNNVTPVSCPITQEYIASFGPGAGHMRNQYMLEKLESWRAKGGKCLPLAFWDGSSSGTKDMILRMRKAGFEPHVHLLGKPKSKRLI